MNCRSQSCRKYFVATVMGLAMLSSACSRQTADHAGRGTNSATSSAHVPIDSPPRILSVVPATVPFADNKVVLGSFHIRYEIDAPERFNRAQLVLRTNAYPVAYADVPLVVRGEADLAVNNQVAIGPTIKLQLQCASGETNWLAVGALRPSPSSVLPRIENISPDSVPELSDLDQSGGGMDAPFEFRLWGAGFQADCKPRFSVNNGEPIEARGGFQTPSVASVYITRRPLGTYDWSNQRYLELFLTTDKKVPDVKPRQHVWLVRTGAAWTIPVVD